MNFYRVRSDMILIGSYKIAIQQNWFFFYFIRSDKYPISSYTINVHVGQNFYRVRPAKIIHDKNFWSASYQILHDKNSKITMETLLLQWLVDTGVQLSPGSITSITFDRLGMILYLYLVIRTQFLASCQQL